MIKRPYYWDSASEEIGRLLRKYITPTMNICEVGCGGGHFLHFLHSVGCKRLTGIEIREKQFDETKNNFLELSLDIALINANILTVYEKYDVIYSTGLLQCLDMENRRKMIKHVRTMSPLALFVVPEITEMRNIGAKQDVAVAGCTEYPTGSLEWELSCFYKVVHSGIISKKTIRLEDNFLYYVCL